MNEQISSACRDLERLQEARREAADNRKRAVLAGSDHIARLYWRCWAYEMRQCRAACWLLRRRVSNALF